MKKILLVCNFTMKESDYRYGILTTLKRNLKIEVKHITLHEDLWSAYSSFRPDIILFVKGLIDEEVRKYLKKERCITIQLYPDDPDRYDQAKNTVNMFDYYYTNSSQALEWYHKDGYNNVKVCTFAVDELLYNIEARKEYKCDILFIGSDGQKKYRHTYLEVLKGLDIKVYGKWSKEVPGYQGKCLYGEDYFSAMKSCKIGLDFNISGSGYYNIKNNTMAVLASGGLLMAQAFFEIKRYFSNKEAVYFDNPKELRELCEYYLYQSERREEIAKSGHEKFLAHHTWEKRLESIWSDINVEL